MTEIHLINSMNQSIINKIIEFKNKEIKKEQLNKYMLLNLCFILKTTNKIKAKNEKIQKKQNIEIQKSLSKIKSYHSDINYNPKELETIPIMKKIVNPTIELYMPISEISYSTEIQFYKKNSDKCDFNESLLFKKKYQKESENEEKELYFEEPPLLFLKNSISVKNINNINNIEENTLINLINKDDEDLFEKEGDDIKNKDILFYELINSFDDNNKEDSPNDDIELDFKKIESLFYLDDIFSNQRLSKRNSTDIYNRLSLTSGSTSFGSGNNSRGESKISMNKELYQTEFCNYMSFDFFNKYCQLMNLDYLRYMLVIYSNAMTSAKKYYFCEEKMFFNLIKIFILKIGISSKKIYDKIIQSLLNNKENIYDFENFIKSFSIILKLKEENTVLKYKFIMSLFRFDEEYINVKHINTFLQLIKGKMVNNIDLYEELSHNFIKRYDRIYSNELGTNFKFRNILICLESFFDKHGVH